MQGSSGWCYLALQNWRERGKKIITHTPARFPIDVLLSLDIVLLVASSRVPHTPVFHTEPSCGDIGLVQII